MASFMPSAWSPTNRDEYCLERESGHSFAMSIPYDAYTIQLLLVAFLSTVNNVWVLIFHWTTPPHPKFLLLLDRRISIRMHVLSGTIEIISFVIGWFLGEGARNVLIYVNAAASSVHCLTALYQTPIVFGTQAIMRPAYCACVICKIACVVDVWLHPTCAMKFLRLYNIHSVYTWCRVFMAFFINLNIVNENMYSVSIMLAGFTCCPSCGPGVNIIFAVFIGCYSLILYTFASAETVAHQFNENSRDIFDNPAFQGVLAGTATACPFGNAGCGDKESVIEGIFKAMDKNNSGKVTLEEVKDFAAVHKSQQWATLVDMYVQMNGKAKDGWDMETFKKVVGGKGMLDVSSNVGPANDKLKQVISKSATYEQKARFMFDVINRNPGVDDVISSDEMAYLLLQYSLPIRDVRLVMSKYGKGDKVISFDEFKKGFRPLILFQIAELRGRLKEVASKMQRQETLAQLSIKAARVAPAETAADIS
eukprot:TRINITY_DN14712_c0_g1_i2.p1 TRINITY_DN14712_c0_g1~~TRINITY_DN14712_c0_g1_i2.p1  ORF type:complete len:478 (+),score=86.46 TRINITY_DN14712_c0_g1_i2:110-1543(+)